jgi:hypothetical protein
MSEISQVMQEANSEQNARQPNLVISGWAASRLEGRAFQENFSSE